MFELGCLILGLPELPTYLLQFEAFRTPWDVRHFVGIVSSLESSFALSLLGCASIITRRAILPLVSCASRMLYDPTHAWAPASGFTLPQCRWALCRCIALVRPIRPPFFGNGSAKSGAALTCVGAGSTDFRAGSTQFWDDLWRIRWHKCGKVDPLRSWANPIRGWFDQISGKFHPMWGWLGPMQGWFDPPPIVSAGLVRLKPELLEPSWGWIGRVSVNFSRLVEAVLGASLTKPAKAPGFRENRWRGSESIFAELHHVGGACWACCVVPGAGLAGRPSNRGRLEVRNGGRSNIRPTMGPEGSNLGAGADANEFGRARTPRLATPEIKSSARIVARTSKPRRKGS